MSFLLGVLIKVKRVVGIVWVWFGILDMKVIVVLNFLSEWVKFNIVFVMMFENESGRLSVKKILSGFVFNVLVVCLSLGLIVLKVCLIECIISGKVIIVEDNIVFC